MFGGNRVTGRSVINYFRFSCKKIQHFFILILAFPIEAILSERNSEVLNKSIDISACNQLFSFLAKCSLVPKRDDFSSRGLLKLV